MKRLLTGLKPTGELTLGNYLGAIKQVVGYQDEFEVFLFVADLHCLTIDHNTTEVHKNIMDFIALYIACGIDPKKVHIYIQSDCPYITSLSWILECNTYYGEMSRMIQFKEKTKNQENFKVGIFTYPALMAADILAVDANIVPVGIDQKQHVELTRDVAQRFNNKYGDVFVIPDVKLNDFGFSIKDLQDPTKKMSKTDDSKKGVIALLDDLDFARKKIMGATTDSETIIKYDELNKPGISNLIVIYSLLTGISIEDVENKFKDNNYGEFKKEVANVVVDFLSKVQNKYNQIIEDKELINMLNENAKIVNDLVKEKYEDIRIKLGIYK